MSAGRSVLGLSLQQDASLSACNTTNSSSAGLTLRVQLCPKSHMRVRYLSGCRKYSKMLWLYGQLAPRTHTLSCKQQRCAADRRV